MPKKTTVTVKSGESWASIAGKVYGDQRMFEELMRANKNISMLRPGQTLVLPTQRRDPYVSEFGAAAVGMATDFTKQGQPVNAPGGPMVAPGTNVMSKYGMYQARNAFQGGNSWTPTPTPSPTAAGTPALPGAPKPAAPGAPQTDTTPDWWQRNRPQTQSAALPAGQPAPYSQMAAQQQLPTPAGLPAGQPAPYQQMALQRPAQPGGAPAPYFQMAGAQGAQTAAQMVAARPPTQTGVAAQMAAQQAQFAPMGGQFQPTIRPPTPGQFAPSQQAVQTAAQVSPMAGNIPTPAQTAQNVPLTGQAQAIKWARDEGNRIFDNVSASLTGQSNAPLPVKIHGSQVQNMAMAKGYTSQQVYNALLDAGYVYDPVNVTMVMPGSQVAGFGVPSTAGAQQTASFLPTYRPPTYGEPQTNIILGKRGQMLVKRAPGAGKPQPQQQQAAPMTPAAPSVGTIGAQWRIGG